MAKKTNKQINVLISRKWPWLGYFLIFGISFIIFLYILIPPGIMGPDSFYHTKMALMIKNNGIIQNFPWTQFTTYKDLFVDHHFGYHYLLIPFLKLPTPENLDVFSAEIDPLIKTKLATVFFAALAFLFIYWLLRYLKVKAPLFWSLIPFLVPPFILRLSLIRAPSVSIIILILGFYFILNKKYFLVFITSFLYVWIYGAWPLILVATLIYCFASAIKSVVDNKRSGIFDFFKYIFNKNNLKLLVSCILGLGAGLIINPYFPKTLTFYWFQTVKIAILNYHSQIGVGAEWYPPEPTALLANIFPILIFWVIGVAWFIIKNKKQEISTWFFLFLSIFFLLYTYKSQRNIEYFIPSAIFFSGLNFTQIIKKIRWDNIKNHIVQLLKGQESIFYFLITIYLILTTGLCFIFFTNHSILNLHNKYTTARPLNHFQMACYWLKNNTQPGEIVFQSDWDIFPELFYFNTHNYYINGLDQTFMYEKDKDLYQIWMDLVSNKTNPNNTAQIIKQKFHASYILVSKENEKFVKLLQRSASLEKMYEDHEAIIYKIL